MRFGQRQFNSGRFGGGSLGAAIIISIHGPRVGFPAPVESIHGPFVGFPTLLTSAHGPLVGFGQVISIHGPLVGFPTIVESIHGPRVGLPNATHYEAFLQTPTDVAAVLARTYHPRILLHNPIDGGTINDLTPYVRSWTLTQNRNLPATWVITLDDADRAFIPRLPALSTYFGKFDQDSFNHLFIVRRYFTIEIHSAGETWVSPHLLHSNEYEWDISGGVCTAALSGTDLSEMLLQEDEEMEDWVSTSSRVYYAKEIIVAILANFGITAYRLEFEDFPVIPKFSFKEQSGLDSIEDLLWVRQAEWWFDRDQFVARARNYSPTGAADYELIDVYHLQRTKYKRRMREMKNEFTIRKVSPYSNVVGEFDQEDVGFVPVDLIPTRNARIRVDDIVKGTAIQAVWFGEGGEASGAILAVNSMVYSGSIPAYHVRFVYEPVFGNEPFSPRVVGQVIGIPVEDEALPPGAKNAFTVTRRNASSQVKYGRRKDRTALGADFVPTEEIATDLCDLLIEESARLANGVGWSGVLFPFILPAMTLKITVSLAGITAENYYVESVTKAGTKASANMEIQASYLKV